jgi:hypothetical protein
MDQQQQTVKDFCDKILRLTLRSMYDNHVIEPLNKNLRTFYKAYISNAGVKDVERAAKQVEGSLMIWGTNQTAQGLIVYTTSNGMADAERLIDELYDLVEAYSKTHE